MRFTVFMRGMSKFRAGTFRGDDRDSDDIVRSVQIFSALGYMASMLFDEEKVSGMLSSMKISSMMFYDERNGEYLIFAPKYYTMIAEERTKIKEIKKAIFIYASRISEWVRNASIKHIPKEKSIALVEVPAVAVSRSTAEGGSMLYHRSFSVVRRGFIPYFLTEVDDEYADVFKAAVRLLGDHGLGSDGTYGFGLFKPEIREGFPFEESQGNLWMVLSLFRPSKDELKKIANSKFSRYKILKRGGWNLSSGVPLFKPRVAFMEEGSVFPFKPEGEDIKKDGYIIKGKPIVIRV